MDGEAVYSTEEVLENETVYSTEDISAGEVYTSESETTASVVVEDSSIPAENTETDITFQVAVIFVVGILVGIKLFSLFVKRWFG